MGSLENEQIKAPLFQLPQYCIGTFEQGNDVPLQNGDVYFLALSEVCAGRKIGEVRSPFFHFHFFLPFFF